MALGEIAGGRRTGYALAALTSLSAFLFASVLSATPALHEHLHSDASQPQHECAITIVESATYLVDSAPEMAARRILAEWSESFALPVVWVATLFSNARVFEHAPPVLS